MLEFRNMLQPAEIIFIWGNVQGFISSWRNISFQTSFKVSLRSSRCILRREVTVCDWGDRKLSNTQSTRMALEKFMKKSQERGRKMRARGWRWRGRGCPQTLSSSPAQIPHPSLHPHFSIRLHRRHNIYSRGDNVDLSRWQLWNKNRGSL